MISIRWRLTLFLCLAMAGLFVVTGLGVFVAMKEVLNKRFDETLEAKAMALITASEVDDGGFEVDLTVQDFAGFGKGGNDYFEIRRTGGGLVLRSPSMREAWRNVGRFDQFDAPDEGEVVVFDDTFEDGREARFFLRMVQPKDDFKNGYQDLYLIVGSPTQGIRKDLGLLAMVLMIAGGVAILVMIPLIRSGLARGLRPLKRLSDEIGGIRPEEFDRRLDAERLPAELVPMAKGLNVWLGRLEESFERERRFSSHAAHELRTPLAELRSMAELGANWPEEATQENCAEMANVVGEMGLLLDKLSLLARADSGQQGVRCEEMDFGEAAEGVLARYRDRAEQRGIRIFSEISGETVESDPVLWSAIFQNLLGNAVSHAPAGSEVRVVVSPTGISVINPAPELTEGDLAHLFERFWRKDVSHGGSDHSGLGMSIVKVCAGLLGASCEAGFVEPGLLRTEVRWEL
ncbi:ATP-binding protein [Luteolibacter sp. AS25]|uniref:ATP-binding protein n=1 Tax=Luteolibacter sp. AS25 TaxID=3135776 RepID=UPI00398A7DD4